jgi:hypothetical protein
VIFYGGLASLAQASQSLDISKSQDPSMEDHGIQLELAVGDIEANEQCVQGEVITLNK